MSAPEGRSDPVTEPEPVRQLDDDNTLSWREVFYFPSPWVCAVTCAGSCMYMLLLSLEPHTSPPLLVSTEITVSVRAPGHAPELCVIPAARNTGWHTHPRLLYALRAARFPGAAMASLGLMLISGTRALGCGLDPLAKQAAGIPHLLKPLQPCAEGLSSGWLCIWLLW